MSPPEPLVSALLPVHEGVEVDHLRAALVGLLGQSRVPDEVVVVEDGPLTVCQMGVLDEFETQHPSVTRVRLMVNSGAGMANQAGLVAASGTWIAKFDADDICLPHRIQRQLAAIGATGVDVCGSAMLEFIDDPSQPHAIRVSPGGHDAIGRRMRFNNPINHPTVVFRRATALEVGGYPAWRYMQDYGLFARMYAAGATMMNLPEPLVLFRAGAGVTSRRRAPDIRRVETLLQCELCSLGVVSRSRAFFNMGWRIGYRWLPSAAVSFVSRRLLARRIEGGEAPS